MTNNSLMITNYMNHSYIESQIKRSNDYSSHLCVVKFELKFNPKEAELFKDTISFIYTFLAYSPIIHEGGNHFLIFLHENKLHKVVMNIKNMLMSLKIKFGVTIDNIGVTSYDSSDDKNSLMERVHKFLMKSKISKNTDVYYGTKFFEYGNHGDFNNIKSIYTQEPKLNIYGFYKEAPLMSRVNIIDYTDGSLQVQATQEYLPFLKKQEFVYIEHTMIPDIMRADITKIDFSSGVIILDNMKFLDNSPVHRKNIRITPHRPLRATLEFNNEIYIEGLIADISKSSVLFTTQLSKIEELQAKGLQTKPFELKFHLEGANNNSFAADVKAMIYKVFGNQLVLNIYPSPEIETEIAEYIAMCQNLLLLEVKGTI